MAWQLVGLEEMAPAREHPFVGRRAELDQFEGVLRTCIDTSAGQVIHVRGEAGIGKTRLIEEFQRQASAAGFACHAALVLDFGTGSRRDAVRSLFRSLLDLGPASDPTAVAAAAGLAVERNLIAEAHQVFLNDLLDLPQPSPLDARYQGLDHATPLPGQARDAGRAGDEPAAASHGCCSSRTCTGPIGSPSSIWRTSPARRPAVRRSW